MFSISINYRLSLIFVVCLYMPMNSECRSDWEGKRTYQEATVCFPQRVVWESCTTASLCQCWGNGSWSRHCRRSQRFHPYVPVVTV